jgi:hypothetical protein
MKKSTLPLALALAGLLVSSASAQVFVGSDNFNDNTLTLQGANPQAAGQWRFSSPSAGGAFTETNQRMEFTNSTTTGTNYSSLGWISPSTSITGIGGAGLSSGAPYTSSWSAQVAITNTTVPVAGYTLAGMEFYSTQNPSGSNSYYGIYLSNSQANGNRLMIEWGLWNGVSDYTRTPSFLNIGDITDVTVRASFDTATKIMSFDYATDGATFLSTGISYDLDGAQAGITAPLNNGMGLVLVGFSNGGAGAIAAGDMYYDNLSVSAIPEPSTYAALAGLGALGLAFWRRRQARAAAQA